MIGSAQACRAVEIAIGALYERPIRCLAIACAELEQRVERLGRRGNRGCNADCGNEKTNLSEPSVFHNASSSIFADVRVNEPRCADRAFLLRSFTIQKIRLPQPRKKS
jgi:hypothetical protein